MGPEASTRTEGPLDGPAVREMFAAATRHLELHAEAVNALNVFPVPDGDTGTNMLLTMQAAMEAIPDEAPHARDVLSAMAHGSLMGARGNSGVILSQIVRGFHLAAEEADVLGGSLELAEGHFTVPGGPGLGVRLDLEVVERYRVG